MSDDHLPGGRAWRGRVSGETARGLLTEGSGAAQRACWGHGGYHGPVTFEVGSQIFSEKLFVPEAMLVGGFPPISYIQTP